MHRVSKLQNRSLFSYLFVIIVFLSLTSCAGFNRIVLEENRIPLSEGQATVGTFTDGASSVSYKYSVDGDNLFIKGELSTRGSISWFKVRLLLLDKKGGIVESRNIYTSGYRNYRHGSNTFALNVPLAAEIAGFTFDFYVEYRSRR